MQTYTRILKTRSHYVVLSGMELAIQTSWLQLRDLPGLVSARMKGTPPHSASANTTCSNQSITLKLKSPWKTTMAVLLHALISNTEVSLQNSLISYIHSKML